MTGKHVKGIGRFGCRQIVTGDVAALLIEIILSLIILITFFRGCDSAVPGFLRSLFYLIAVRFDTVAPFLHTAPLKTVFGKAAIQWQNQRLPII
jgi:hypothetical protein